MIPNSVAQTGLELYVLVWIRSLFFGNCYIQINSSRKGRWTPILTPSLNVVHDVGIQKQF